MLIDRRLLGVYGVAAFAWLAMSASLANASSHILLIVSGAIQNPGPSGSLEFDMAALDRLDQISFTTTTPWTAGPTTFQGVSGRAFIAAIGARGSVLRAKAMNDYGVTIPIDDFLSRGAIIATRINGAPVSVREKGPLWVVYPYDSDSSLKSQTYQHRSIWQLVRIHVE